ncbi:hypothetical protein OESDEN_15432 [Oesophagostomum dentatum]|uniref:Uncharacterized protein n=1 Tax=Oesophagostomum dentatum TaxID=61180 RepID=A0A0B1SIV0_OESDE|nr:hypothetical protein OESDEN_15432 [Oesophagostomum dentatum]
MKKLIAYEDEHFDLKAFDSLLEDYIQEEDFKEKSFLEIKEKFGRLTMDEMFRCLSECKAGVKHSRPFGDIADPNSRVFLNMIGRLP